MVPALRELQFPGALRRRLCQTESREFEPADPVRRAVMRGHGRREDLQEPPETYLFDPGWVLLPAEESKAPRQVLPGRLLSDGCPPHSCGSVPGRDGLRHRVREDHGAGGA